MTVQNVGTSEPLATPELIAEIERYCDIVDKIRVDYDKVKKDFEEYDKRCDDLMAYF